MRTRDLTRLTFEYTDGSIETIDGAAALEWQEAVDGQAVFCHIHGQSFPKIERTVVRGPTSAPPPEKP